MKSNKEQLLADVVAEGARPELRAALFQQTLQLAHRRRNFRRARSAALSAVAVAGLAFFFTRFQSPQPSAIVQPLKPAFFTFVQTQPLRESELVRTHSSPGLNIVATSSSVEVVTTAQVQPEVKWLDENQLLALVGTAPVILVHNESGSADLYFANPKDREAFFHD